MPFLVKNTHYKLQEKSLKISFLSISFLYILSIILQIQMHQDPDMLFALEGGKRLLAGGTYVNDVFETNPPLIFYFSMFINVLARFFSVSSVFLFKLVTYIVAIYSLSICHYLLGTKHVEPAIRTCFLITLAFCFLILSTNFNINNKSWNQ